MRAFGGVCTEPQLCGKKWSHLEKPFGQKDLGSTRERPSWQFVGVGSRLETRPRVGASGPDSQSLGTTHCSLQSSPYFMLRIGFGAPNSLVGECYNFPILQRGTRARRAKGQLHATRLVAEKLEVRGGCPDCLSLPHDFPATRDEGKGRGLGGSDLCDSQRPSAGQARGHQTSHPHPGPSSSGVPKAT